MCPLNVDFQAFPIASVIFTGIGILLSASFYPDPFVVSHCNTSIF